MSAPPRRALFSATPPRVCAIAGSDSGGGAGIQADLKTAQALGAYGLSVVTALTAQNTRGVSAIHAVPPAFVSQQLAAVRSDIAVDAWKVGMLADAAIIAALGEELRSGDGLGGE
jgi:hydroxymethylpyrimidine kinase/phosphomethylpyrimidine kinase